LAGVIELLPYLDALDGALLPEAGRADEARQLEVAIEGKSAGSSGGEFRGTEAKDPDDVVSLADGVDGLLPSLPEQDQGARDRVRQITGVEGGVDVPVVVDAKPEIEGLGSSQSLFSVVGGDHDHRVDPRQGPETACLVQVWRVRAPGAASPRSAGL
jgi:hypothetical protein